MKKKYYVLFCVPLNMNPTAERKQALKPEAEKVTEWINNDNSNWGLVWQ